MASWKEVSALKMHCIGMIKRLMNGTDEKGLGNNEKNVYFFIDYIASNWVHLQ